MAVSQTHFVMADPVQGQPPPEFYRALVDKLNEPRHLSIKSVPCESYRSGSDFDLWVVGFVDTVRASHNIAATDARLGTLCLNWISTKLEVGTTRSVYDNLPEATKQDWPTLRQALSDAFKDESEEIRFLNRDDAFKRNGMALIDYKNGLLHRMSKYQSGLKAVPAEWERTAVRRFLAGLQDPVLSAHILMTCRNENHTLDRAYSVASNYENTIETITHNGPKQVLPNMASMLIPQMASLASDPPQFSALSPAQEKVNERLEALETAAKKHELDVTEVKAGLSEVKEGLNQIKEEIAQSKIARSFAGYPRPAYQHQVKPLYPMARMPLSSSRSYVPASYGTRPRVVPGLTNGPGYVATPQASYGNQGNPQPQRSAPQNLSTQSTQIGTRPNLLSLPQRPPGPSFSAMSEPSAGQDRPEQFANPNLQYGAHDLGHGWTNADVDDAISHGYDAAPEGMYVYSDMPF